MYRINTIPGEAAKSKGHASYPEDFPTCAPARASRHGKLGRIGKLKPRWTEWRSGNGWKNLIGQEVAI